LIDFEEERFAVFRLALGQLDLDALEALLDLLEGGAVAVDAGQELLGEGFLAFLVVLHEAVLDALALAQEEEEGADESEDEDFDEELETDEADEAETDDTGENEGESESEEESNSEAEEGQEQADKSGKTGKDEQE